MAKANLTKYRKVITDGQCHPSAFTVLVPSILSAAIVAAFDDTASIETLFDSCLDHFDHFAIVHDGLIVRSR